MKNIFIVILFYLGMSSFSQAHSFNMTCATKGELTTSVLVNEVGSKVTITWIHHNGFDYAPIHNGLVTSKDLVTLAYRAQKLKALGTKLQVSFDKAKCKVLGDKIFYCENYANEKLSLNSSTFQALSFFTGQSTDVGIAGTFKGISATLMIDIDNQSYFLPMRYSEDDCESLAQNN